MDYYKLFNLEREPFSNTPDPDFFYRSTRHVECLQKLEIAVRLRRGLCIVQGEVGTGKTTLCRQLIRTLSTDESIRVHLILDPCFEGAELMAAALNRMLNGREKAAACSTMAEHKEMIKDRLFRAGVDGQEATVLIIDEGQKLPGRCIEFMREILNYETNRHKLIQIVVFAQEEMADLLAAHPNFADRAALYHHLGPLSRGDTARLIRYRLDRAGAGERTASTPVFTHGALRRIHRHSRGYPRRIVNLAHTSLLLLLIKGTGRATRSIVNQAAKSLPAAPPQPRISYGIRAAGVSAAAALILLAALAGARHWSGPAPSREQGRGAPSERWEIPARPVEAASPSPPATLGGIRIIRNEKLWDMLERVYGSATVRLLEEVKAANPHIEDPNLIRPGETVSFPVPEARPVESGERCWIAWEESADLEQAYRALAARRDAGLRILSYWTPRGGAVHALVRRGSFAGAQEARRAMEDIRPELRREARLLDLGDPGVRLLGAPADQSARSVGK